MEQSGRPIASGRGHGAGPACRAAGAAVFPSLKWVDRKGFLPQSRAVIRTGPPEQGAGARRKTQPAVKGHKGRSQQAAVQWRTTPDDLSDG